MRRLSLPIGIFAIACGLMTNAPTAQAGIESWVSGTGSDAGTCPITAPCKTFAYAHIQTTGGGAINVLSSGNFGPLTITKPISIVADGVEAVINTAAGGAAIIVQAGATHIVSLRGLTIDVAANIGISFVSGAALQVQNCVIRRSTNGIKFVPASGIREFTVADSVIADTSSHGILVERAGSGSAKVVLDRVRVDNASNGSGIAFVGATAGGFINATVRDSVAARNSAGAGIFAHETGGGTIDVLVDRSAAVNNSSGIRAKSGTTIRIGDSTVTGNTTFGLFADSGVIESYGTNKVNGNSTNVSGTITPVAYQ